MTQSYIEAGPLTRLQLDIEKALEAHPYFGDIPVITERSKDPQGEMDAALAPISGQGGKSGICCVVLTPKLKISKPNMPGPFFDRVRLVVLTVENPLINTSDSGTHKPAADVSLAVAAVGHHMTDPENRYGCLNCMGAGISDDARFEDYLVYATEFETQIGMKIELITNK